MLGNDAKPTQVEQMIMPPIAHGVKFISIGQFTDGNTPVTWRGPMLHRALQQFLADVYWGDLDVLLLDLPPGTGDVAISIAQLIPGAEILVVTTPQQAAAEVAERAGAIALQTRQKVLGVVENMSWLELPDGSRMTPFGEGGGEQVAQRLSRMIGATVPLLGQVPLETSVREGGDAGVPVVLSAPESPAGAALGAIADKLAVQRRGLAGMSLGIDTARRNWSRLPGDCGRVRSTWLPSQRHCDARRWCAPRRRIGGFPGVVTSVDAARPILGRPRRGPLALIRQIGVSHGVQQRVVTAQQVP